MKMTAEYASGQIIFKMRNSNLHYMSKETHLSTYITLRKKLIEKVDETSNICDVADNGVKNMDEKIRLENGLLKQDINILKTTCENLEVEKEQLEMSNESYRKTIDSLQEKLDNEKKDSRKFKDTLEDKEVDNVKMCENIKEKNEELKYLNETMTKLKIECVRLNSCVKELDEKNFILEYVVANKNKKVSDLEDMVAQIKSCDMCAKVCKTASYISKHDEENTPSTSKCDSCDYESDDENDVTSHMKSKHEFLCKICGLSFESETKLKKHTCKVNVENPMCGDFYTKSYVVVDCCTIIFSKSKEKEVVYLHSEQCFKNLNRCSDLYPSYDMTNYDGEAYHVPLSEYFSGGKIKWDALDGEFIRIR